jgi:bacillopeptidase F
MSSPTPTNWEIGDPSGAGPGTAYSGANCSGTNIVDDYYPSADITLVTPFVELGTAPMILSFFTWYNMDTGGEDGGFIEISANGGPWSQIWPVGGYPWVGGYMGGYFRDGYSGNSAGWEYEEFDLSAYAGQAVQVRFHFAASDWWGWQWGWYVDDVYITQVLRTTPTICLCWAMSGRLRFAI